MLVWPMNFKNSCLQWHTKTEWLIKENKKRASKKKRIEIEYHVQNDADVSHKDVNIFCNTKQFPSLPFCCPHKKLHGVTVLIKHYCMLFDSKLGHGICTIRHIPCACDECTYMLDKPWIPGLTKKTTLPKYHWLILLSSSRLR